MNFTSDKQTLDDLNLLGKYKNNSIYDLFNRNKTRGGERLLDEMFRHPLTDVGCINERSTIIRYFGRNNFELPIEVPAFMAMENYLRSASDGNVFSATLQTVRRKALLLIGLKEEYEHIRNGLIHTLAVLSALKRFVSELLNADADNPFRSEIEKVQVVLNDKRLNGLWRKTDAESGSISFSDFVKYDYLLRYQLKNKMKEVLDFVYHADVYISIAETAVAKGFCYARALTSEKNILSLKDVYHPTLEKAVANSLTMNGKGNVVFLTGANMAGKSTYMKSFGVAMYLAHMGFPIPATGMEFSVKEGMFTSINVPDNLDMGYSHFYAEVLRVKKVAEEVAASRDLIVIFDELFKGTNVKDAYDATLAVSEAMSEYRNCLFIISTHIVEVGDALGQSCENIQFSYMPTIMDGKVPRYTYRAQQGISSDRHGMMIIENERILDIIQV